MVKEFSKVLPNHATLHRVEWSAKKLLVRNLTKDCIQIKVVGMLNSDITLGKL